MEYGADSRKGYRSGVVCAIVAAQNGVSFQAASEKSSREAGHCSEEVPDSDIRARLLLALAWL
jgi:hypothetical protein